MYIQRTKDLQKDTGPENSFYYHYIGKHLENLCSVGMYAYVSIPDSCFAYCFCQLECFVVLCEGTLMLVGLNSTIYMYYLEVSVLHNNADLGIMFQIKCIFNIHSLFLSPHLFVHRYSSLNDHDMLLQR